MSTRMRWIVGVPIAVAVAVSGGTWAYINLGDDPPERLSVDAPVATTATTTPAAPRQGDNGVWKVSDGSEAGYRVKEILFGQSTVAVGRTTSVTGQIELDGTTVTDGEFSVDMTSVTSDKERRDGQFRGRIMAVSQFPTSTFTLSSPIELGTLPADGAKVTVPATGDLTLRGTTKEVSFDVDVVRSASSVRVGAAIPIVFAEWGIPNPSFGPAETENHGELEVLLVLT